MTSFSKHMNSFSPAQFKALTAYKKAFQLFRTGVIWLDKDGALIGANQKVSEYLQYPAAELEEKKIFEIDPHLNLLSWKKIWKTLQSTGEYQAETEYITADGLLVPVQVDGVLLQFEDTAWALLVVENLMESRRLKDLLDVTAKAGKVGSWELDLVKDEISITGECQRLLGLQGDLSVYQSDEFLDFISDLIPSTDLENLKETLRQSILKGSPFESEIIFESKEGGFQRLSINGFPQRSELDQTIKIFGAVKDISNFEAKTEELYLTQFTVDHSKELIFWVRPDGSFAYVNRAVCQRLGYTKDELMSLNSEDIAPSFDEKARNSLWEELRSKKYMENEINLLAKDGSSFPLYSTLNYIKFKDQEFNCVFSIDYSEKRKAQEELLLTRFTMENAQEMILWVDADGKILFANQKFHDLSGYSKEDITSMDVSLLYGKSTANEDRTRLWELLRKEKNIEVESELVLQNGDRIPVYCSLNYINYEGKELDCIFMRDWSKKKSRDKELLLAQKTFETAKELIFWVKESGEIQFTNQATREVLGFSKKELSNYSFTDICRDTSIMDLAFYTDDTETEFLTRGGALLPIELSRNRLEIDEEVIWCFIARNISKRKKRETALRQAQQKVEELSLRLKDENVLLREEIVATHNFNNIITCSSKYRQVLGQIGQVADSTATVLILGETGTGKELLARAIHSLSDREDSVMIKVNCAALPENLIESELFGHEKGAFTGASEQRKGRFEQANKSTIFLDEIGEMPLELQAKLLRVLQEGEFERLGGSQPIKVDVRIIAATNRNLEKMVKEGRFREDLYYRLNVFPITNMPLRERKEDIPLLVKYFAKKFGDRQGKKIKKIPQADLNLLNKYPFPGNIRELENMVERAVIISTGETLDLKSSFARNQTMESAATSASEEKFLAFEDMQRQHILKALRLTFGRVTGPEGAGRLLGLNDRTLASKMRKLGIRKEDYLGT